MEAHLIHLCLEANSALLNEKKTRFATEVVIPGLLNNPPGSPSSEALALRSLLSLG